MATKKQPANQDNHLALYRKYFPNISPTRLVSFEPLIFEEEELSGLLQIYRLSSHFPIFSRLAMIAPSFVSSWKHSHHMVNALNEINNQEVDLINLAWKLKTGKVGWIELRCNTGDKVKLSYLASTLELGEAIMERFSNIEEEKNLGKLKKEPKEIGRPSRMESIQQLIVDILVYLDRESNLRCGDSLISNKQAGFISDFLKFAKVIEPDSTKVLDEEYIRTTLNNYKAKYPEVFISLFPKHLK